MVSMFLCLTSLRASPFYACGVSKFWSALTDRNLTNLFKLNKYGQ